MKKKILIICVAYIVFYGVQILPQSTSDSLRQRIELTTNEKEKLTLLIKLIDKTIHSDENVSELLKRAKEISDKIPEGVLTAKLHLLYGKYFDIKGRYKDAADSYLLAQKIAERENDDEILESALNNLAVINMRIGNYNKGIEIFRKLLEMAESENKKDAVLEFTLNLAMGYGESGDMEKAEEFLLKTYRLSDDNKFYKTVAANNLSYLYNNSQEFRKGLKYAEESVRYSEELEKPILHIEALTNYSSALLGQKKFAEAKKVIEKSISIARKNNFVRQINNGLGNLALVSEGMKNYKDAYNYYKAFSEMKDSLLNESITKQINELQIKYETEKKDKELALQKTELNKRNTVILVAVLAILFLLVFGITVTILYRMKDLALKELVKKNIELLNSEETIQKLKESKINGEETKQGYDLINDKKRENLEFQLDFLMSNEKVFLDKELTLEKLAVKLKVNSKYISKIINENYNQNFSDFVNSYRIKEAARMLKSETYRNISIDGIGQTVGFKSKSAFYSSFKKFMGLTPAYFSTKSKNYAVVP